MIKRSRSPSGRNQIKLEADSRCPGGGDQPKSAEDVAVREWFLERVWGNHWAEKPISHGQSPVCLIRVYLPLKKELKCYLR